MGFFSPTLYALQSAKTPLIYAIASAFIFSIAARLIWKEPFLPVLLFYAPMGVPVALVAYGAGLLTGLSRAPAVGTVLPATLAVVAGLNVYLFGTDSKYKVAVGYCVFLMITTLFLGIQAGAQQRDEDRADYLISLSEKELQVRKYRKNLGLPDEIPDWILGK